MSKKTPEQAIEDKIEAFRKNITKKYGTALLDYQYDIQKLVRDFYNNPKNEGKEAPEIPEPEIETSDQTKSLYKKWNPLLEQYKEITGKIYKKPILFNPDKEKAQKANQKEKDKARIARDALLAKKEEEKAKRQPAPKPKLKPKPKSSDYNDAVLRYGMTGEDLNNLIQNIDKSKSVKVPVKLNKGLFDNMKDLVNSVIEEEKKIEGLKPFIPEKNENRDRTGKLLTDEELAQLKRIRERLSKNIIPENVIVGPSEVKPANIKKMRGRPIDEKSKRQQKLASTEPVIPKKRGRRPKKIIVEETKEETKQEETKEGEPKRKRGRPKKPDSELSRPRVVPELVVKGKKGRPSKCEKVLPKNNTKLNNIFTRPIIEWIDIDKKHPLSLSQKIEPKLLQYSKMNKDVFFDIMDMFFKFRLGNIKSDIKKNATKGELFVIYRKICDFAIFYGFTTAYEIEQALITRIRGDLQDKPSELKRFEGFLQKNCIGKEVNDKVKKESLKQNKNKVYKLQDLTGYDEVVFEGKLLRDRSIDEIFRDVFVGKNASIRMNNGKIEVVDFETDEEGNALPTKIWQYKKTKPLLIRTVKRIIDAVKDVVDDETYKLFIKDYNDDPQSIYDLIIERIPEI